MSYEPQFEQDVIQRLTRIETLAITTNGRVTDLEDKVDEHEKVLNKGRGIMWFAGLLWLLLLGLFGLKVK